MTSAGQQAKNPRPAEDTGMPVPPAPDLAARHTPARLTAIAATYWPVAASAAVMAVMGLWGLARDSAMGNDEVATRYAAMLSLRQLAHLLRHVDAVHGFYYLLIHGWIALGNSPEVLRIPSVMAMIAAVAMTAALARRLTGSSLTALLAGLIMALTPAISYYAQTARSYALVFACAVGSTLVLLRALAAETSPSRERGQVARLWVLYGALAVLGGYLNEMALLVPAAHAVTIWLARCDRAIVVRWAATAAASVILVIPLAVISSRQGAAIAWIAPPNPANVKLLIHDYLGATLAADVVVFALVAAGTLLLASDGASTGLRWLRAGTISLQSVAVPLLTVPAGLLIIESFIAKPLYVDRYVLYGEAGAALLAASGLVAIGQRVRATGWRVPTWVPAAVACLCILLLQLTPQMRVRTPQSRKYDFGGPARYVEASARPGDGILFFDAFYRKDRLGYPQDFTKTI